MTEVIVAIIGATAAIVVAIIQTQSGNKATDSHNRQRRLQDEQRASLTEQISQQRDSQQSSSQQHYRQNEPEGLEYKKSRISKANVSTWLIACTLLSITTGSLDSYQVAIAALTSITLILVYLRPIYESWAVIGVCVPYGVLLWRCTRPGTTLMAQTTTEPVEVVDVYSCYYSKDTVIVWFIGTAFVVLCVTAIRLERLARRN